MSEESARRAGELDAEPASEEAASAGTPAFSAPVNRDAWATIRGFVYQADLTIERWLRLTPGQELHLECGEDIDTVTNYLEGSGEERLLEQIKYRESRVTLRTESALEALANALEHQRNNEGSRLFFRYVTNAQAGTERFAHTPAIPAWEKLRYPARESPAADPIEEVSAGNCEQAEDHTIRLLGVVRKALRAAVTPPPGLSPAIWDRFRVFTEQADDAHLLDFIDAFEWSLGNPSADEMGGHIQSLLLEQGYASGAVAAYQQYQRLFLCVMKRLSRRGLKCLHSAELPDILAQPLSEEDRIFFERFLGQMGLLDRRLAVIQAQMAQQEGALAAVGAQLNRLLEGNRVQAFTLATPLPLLDPPTTSERLSPRGETVGALLQDLERAPWLGLHGPCGTGKSHLALLITAAYGQCPVWLSFRDLSVETAALNLDQVFLYLGGEEALSRRSERFAVVLRTLGERAVVVLDDLPRLLSGDVLAQRLDLLGRAAQQTGVKLITTSQNALPGRLRNTLRELVVERRAPPLTDIEGAEVLRAYGAPDRLIQNPRVVRFLNRIAHGHPTLLGAVATYLGGQAWAWTDQQLDGLFRGQFAEGLNDETLGRLLATVTDDESRTLLYRLNTVFCAFDLETAQLLAEQAPAISRPQERLHLLSGLWIQPEAGQRFRVSPLIGALGSGNLSASELRSCCWALAKRCLARPQVSSNDLHNAITYLLRAGEHERAVGVLTYALSTLHGAISSGETDAATVKKTGIPGLLWDLPVPGQVSVNVRMLLRAYQVHVAPRLGLDPSFAVKDLAGMVDMAGEDDGAGLLAAATLAGKEMAELHYSAACRCAAKALVALPQVLPDDPTQSRPSLADGANLILCSLILASSSKADILRWCALVGDLPPATRRQALDDTASWDSGAMLLVDRWWLAETERPPDEQDWERILTDLDDIARAAEAAGADLLVGAAIRGKVLVLCERMEQPDRALQVVEHALPDLHDPRSAFAVCEAMGQKLTYQEGRETEAAVWFEKADVAVSSCPPSMHLQRAMLLLGQARLADRAGRTGEAVTLLERAVDLLRGFPFVHATAVAKMLAELALAHWHAGDFRRAFEALDTAAPGILAMGRGTPAPSALFRLFAHLAGFMASAASGTPLVLESGETATLPMLGTFHDMKVEVLAANYNPEVDFALPATLARFALAVHADERAVFWAGEAREIARERPEAASAIAVTTLPILPQLAASGRLDAFFASARDAAITLSAGAALFEAGSRALLHEFDPEAVLGGSESPEWDAAERRALDFTLIPLVFILGRLAVEARLSTSAAEQLTALATLAIQLCEEVAAASSRTDDWQEAARLIEACFLDNPVLEAVLQRANCYAEDQRALKVFAYVGGTLQRAAILKEACRVHMAILPYCIASFTHESGPRVTILPFVEAYWGAAVTHRRFCFTPPTPVADEVAQAIAGPVEDRCRRIMEVVATGLGIRLDRLVNRGFQEWPDASRVFRPTQ